MAQQVHFDDIFRRVERAGYKQLHRDFRIRATLNTLSVEKCSLETKVLRAVLALFAFVDLPRPFKDLRKLVAVNVYARPLE